jgi:hypothetical protein
MEKWVPRLLGGWVVLNGLAVAAIAALAFNKSPIVYEASGFGPDRIALARIFHPYEASAGWFLIFIAAVFILLGVGIHGRRRWARWAGMAIVLLAVAATLPALVWGVSHREFGVVAGGAAKVALYLVIAMLLSTHAARRVFNK